MSDMQVHRLTWDECDVPVSELFGDTYYSRNDGRAEAAYVFVDGNNLSGRWTARDRFVIGELGFGTGLNFLETWRQWIAARRPGQRLEFVSFEGFPMAARDMARALGVWAQLKPLAADLLSRWTAQAGADERRWQLDAQTQLTVLPGDAECAVGAWSGLADAWYLDGFAPAKNPGMWSAPLMRRVFASTAPGGSFATYTSAGWVRRNLEAAGFEVRKRPGHAGKREMLLGVKPG